MSDARPDGWAWYASATGEYYPVGPELTREAAISAAIEDQLGEEEELDDATGEPFWRLRFIVAECRNRPLALADWIGADGLLERAEEALSESDRVCGEYDDGDIFGVSDAQREDLIARIRRACDDWQTTHGLLFTVNSFEATRNEETVTHRLSPETAE